VTSFWNGSGLQTFVCKTRGMATSSRQRPVRAATAAAAICAVLVASLPSGAAAVTIAQHPLPGGASAASGIAAVAGGLAITRSEQSSTFLERIATSPFAAGPLEPADAIALGPGPDGQLLLLDVVDNAGAVALERQPAGGALEPRFAFPIALGPGFWPEQLASAPDGSLWIANMTAGTIERLSPQGALTSYALPRSGAPTSVAVAPDGSVWATEPITGTIGEIAPGGAVSEHALAGADPEGFGNAEPFSIVLGPDGALWFTEEALGRIGRISTQGALQEFPIPNTSAVAQGEYGSPAPRYIADGPEGALWFTDGGDESIGRITTSGQVSEYPIGTSTPSSPQGIVSAGGELWFVEANLDALGSVDPDGQPAPAPVTQHPQSASTRAPCPTRRAGSTRSGHRATRGRRRGCASKGRAPARSRRRPSRRAVRS
jgi:virginiamycin B lyase